MKLVTKHLLKAFISPLLTCMVAFNAIFIIFDLFGNLSKIIDSHAGPLMIVRYYFGVISAYFGWFVPASCMLAALYTMWQLSHFNELTAMRTSGISFHRLTLPFFIVAVIMSMFTLVNSEFILPEVSDWSDRLEKASFSNVKPERKQNLLYVGANGVNNWRFYSVDTSTYDGFQSPGALEVKWKDKETEILHGIRTDDARFFDGVWWFHFPHILKFDIDGSELNTPNITVNVPEYVPMPQLKDNPMDMYLMNRKWEFLSGSDMLRVIAAHGQNDSEKLFDFWYRTAAPWACVVVTIFAIPAGIRTGRQSVLRGVIMAVSSFFGFYALSMTLKFFGQQGMMSPSFAAWLPNIMFLVLGVAMYRRLT